jgi:hypothetical protein
MTDKKFGVHVNMLGNEMRNVSLEKLPSHPENVVDPGDGSIIKLHVYEGRIYYNTTDDTVYIRTANAWVGFGTGSGNALITEDIPNLLGADLGGITTTGKLDTGLTVTQAFKKLLTKIFNPTLVQPSVSLASSVTGTVEVGTIITTLNLTATFNQGQIIGALVGDTWNPSAVQTYSGTASNYTIDGVDLDMVNVLSKPSYVVQPGANNWNCVVDHVAGTNQPQNSDGTFLPVCPAGSRPATTSLNGGRYHYVAVDTTVVAYTTSGAIRALSNKNFTRQTTINVPTNTRQVSIMFPASEGSLTRAINSSTGYDDAGSFVLSSVVVEGASAGYSVAYNVYTFTFVGPWDGAAFTYALTFSA